MQDAAHAQRLSKTGKTVGAVIGIAAVIVAGVLWLAPGSQRTPPPPAATPEQNAVEAAEKELARANPEFLPAGIVQDGAFPVQRTLEGYVVRLSCQESRRLH